MPPCCWWRVRERLPRFSTEVIALLRGGPVCWVLPVGEDITQRLVAHAALLLVADAVAFAEILDGDNRFAHGRALNGGRRTEDGGRTENGERRAVAIDSQRSEIRKPDGSLIMLPSMRPTERFCAANSSYSGTVIYPQSRAKSSEVSVSFDSPSQSVSLLTK